MYTKYIPNEVKRNVIDFSILTWIHTIYKEKRDTRSPIILDPRIIKMDQDNNRFIL